MTAEWFVGNPAPFVDKRSRLTRVSGLVRQNVRAWHATMTRRVEGRQEFDRCPHAHTSQASARKCAERAVRRVNRRQGSSC